jgi:hypothetical protein
MLILAAKEAGSKWWLALVYVPFLRFWTNGSFSCQIPHDEPQRPDSVAAAIGGLTMGAFSALFVAAPALVVFGTAQKSAAENLPDFISCQRVSIWQKAVAVLP